jgi:formylglycine-generating enzyme required for sulfatase activity
LPTEAEWEKACRGGNADAEHAWGDDSPESFEYFQGEWTGPKAVAAWRPNGFGLFNMGDNVHEWCSDWFDPGYYAISPADNPRGPDHGKRRSSRGGAWRHHIKFARCAARSSIPPEFRYADYGFRIAVAPDFGPAVHGFIES